MLKNQLRVTGYGFRVIALGLFLVGCQSVSTLPPVSQPITRNPPFDKTQDKQPKTTSSQPETLSSHPESGFKRRYISLQGNSGNSIKILAEIADEPQAQAQGLMFREALPVGEGMLFIFPDEAPRGFWMKNTLIPLDILFFSASGDWVSGLTMTPCEGDPCPSYASQGAAKYALEIPEGFIAKTGVAAGWNIIVEGQ